MCVLDKKWVRDSEKESERERDLLGNRKKERWRWSRWLARKGKKRIGEEERRKIII